MVYIYSQFTAESIKNWLVILVGVFYFVNSLACIGFREGMSTTWLIGLHLNMEESKNMKIDLTSDLLSFTDSGMISSLF